ncbi:MAG: nickel-dependent hydrogenase large subunit [Gammaproteobacteria bacterium]
MTVEGKIKIALAHSESGVHRVSIQSSRPIEASKILIGKNPEQALATVPLLFSICGQAHAYAACRAIRLAIGAGIDPAADLAGRFLVNLETVREHGLRILLDGPRLLGMQPEQKPLAAFMRLPRLFMPLLFEQGEAFRLESRPALQSIEMTEQINLLERLIDESVFQGGLSGWLELETEAHLQDWLKRTRSLPASLLSYLYRRSWAGIGNSPIEHLPELNSKDLRSMLKDSRFCRTPQWFGRCYETGPLSRQHMRPLLANLSVRYGNGLLCRIVARLLEVGRMPATLRELQANLEERFPANDEPVEAGCGLVQVQAARGLLIHEVRLSNGMVEQYRIVAPTEWNFHSDGVAAASLKRLSTGDERILKQQAGWLIYAIDPCVQFEIEINTN